MSEINIYKKYSGDENQATNNTLLMLCHIYRESATKLEGILDAFTDGAFTDGDLRVGPDFGQQEKLLHSVPDGSITQQPLNIRFEVKRGREIDMDQMKRHIYSIKESDTSSSTKKILFALTKEKLDSRIVGGLNELAKKNSIVFSAITFSDIVRELRKNCAEHEANLEEDIALYENWLSSKGLLEEESLGEWIYLVPMRHSMNENKKFSLCFQPPDWKLRTVKFFGLYADKKVQYIGRVATVVTGQLDEKGQFKVETVDFTKNADGKPTSEELQRVNEVFTCGHYKGNGIYPHRYYLFDQLEETEFHKTSRGGLHGRYGGGRERNLSTWLDYPNKKEYSTAEVAEGLRSKEF